jgi:cytochrome d ubiquinol oxidase subunit I
MLFGVNRVGKQLHFLATLMVAFGTLFSAFWILSVNSWMHTPAGYAINDAGQFVPEDWWAIVFNPSFPYRLVHMVLAAYLTTAFIVGGVGAWHLTREPGNPMARLMFSMAMWMACIVAPIQIVAGDFHGLNTLHHQPAKVAAMEGHFESYDGAPLILFGLPDMAAEETRYALEIPKLGSMILTHEWNGRVEGLKAWPPDERPNAEIVFWSFRVMVGIGLAMTALGLWGLWLRFRGRLYEDAAIHYAAVLMAPSGIVAVLAGWITTEVGRQPYTVYGLLTTAESASPLDAPAVASSLAAFVIVYLLVFGAGIFYLLRLMAKSPRPDDPGIPAGEPIRSAGTTPAAALAAHKDHGGGGGGGC